MTLPDRDPRPAYGTAFDRHVRPRSRDAARTWFQDHRRDGVRA